MEKKTKKLVAIRHGQALGNVLWEASFKKGDHSLYPENFTDINSDHWELTELGKEQSERAGEFLRQVLLLKPDTYITSNTARTRQTAGYVFPDAILNFNEPLIRERNYAEFDKMPKPEWEKKLSEAGISTGEDSYGWKVLNGESAKEMEVRLKDFLKKIFEQHKDDDYTFLFTHGDIIQVLRVLLHGISEDKYIDFKTAKRNYVRNCQIFIFELDPDTMELISEKTYFYENGVWKEGQYKAEDGIMEVKEFDK